MKIRHARMEELDSIGKVYDIGRAFMRKTGNQNQWTNGYPCREMLEKDILHQKLYVCEENGTILAVFYFAVEQDPTYAVIDGTWLSDAPYGVVHRIAAAVEGRGVGQHCIRWALEQCGNVRIDTHADNAPMQHTLQKLGFTKCGIIYLEDGDPRVAFEKNEA